MSKHKIKSITLTNSVYVPSLAITEDEFHIGEEYKQEVKYRKVIAIQDNYKLLGYYSIVLADQNGTEKEFINVYNPSSVCGEIASDG